MPTLLLVEDNDLNREMLSRRLERHGYVIQIAVDGLAALSQIAAAPPDLVLMDISLPELDGWEATRRLRAGGCTLPIIALTAHAMSGDRERSLAAGCDEYETKPVKFPRLLEKIERLLESHQP